MTSRSATSVSLNAPTDPAGRDDGVRGLPAVRLGELDAGVIAVGRRGGVAELDRGSTTVSWWIGAEDRWHRPCGEPSTRDRLIGGTPVIESSVRIPSGDAVGRVAVARLDGVPHPSVVFDIENASPIPVAFAYVVESTRPMSIVPEGVAVEGVGVLVLTRPALGYAVAPSADALVEVLAAGGMVAERPVGKIGGSVAVLVPLPHTAHAVATFTPGMSSTDPLVGALGDRERVPGPDRIVAGWSAHAAGGPRLDLADARHRDAYGAAVCDLLLGPDPEFGGDARRLGLHVEALGRLGRVDTPDLLFDLVDLQRANGSFPGDDPVGTTVQFLRAVGAWWGGGAPSEVVDPTLGPLADACRWLDKRKQRAAVGQRRSEVRDALCLAAATFGELDEPEVARAVLDHCGRLGADLAGSSNHTPRARSAAMLGSLSDGLAWAHGDTNVPTPTASARLVLSTIDETVRDGGAALELLAGWDPSRAGESFEAHHVPTRAGLVSFGVRWHGERPALLWELLAWSRRAVPTSFSLVAPSLDPGWSTTEPVGEALLAVPEGAVPASEPIKIVAVHPQPGDSFS